MLVMSRDFVKKSFIFVVVILTHSADGLSVFGNIFPLFRCTGFAFFCGIFSSTMHSFVGTECNEECVFLPFFFGGDRICGGCPEPDDTPAPTIPPTEAPNPAVTTPAPTKAPTVTTPAPTKAPTMDATRAPSRAPVERAPVTLAPVPANPLFNDLCINAFTLIPRIDDPATLVVGSTVGASAAGEKFNGAPVLYYQFVGDDKRVRISTCTAETNYDTALYVQQGIDNIACPDIGGFFRIDFQAVEDIPCDNTGDAATVEFVARRETNYRLAVTGRNEEDSGTFGLSLFFYAMVENDECINAISLNPLQDNDAAVVIGSTANAVWANKDTFNGSPVVYYLFVGDDKRVRISTCTSNTNYDSALYVQEGIDNIACPDIGGFFREDFRSVEDLDCDTTGNAATVEFVARRGTNYRIAVAGRNEDDKGAFGLSLFFYALVENDECINAISLNPLEDDDTAVVVGSTANAVWANRDTFNGSPVVYYLFVGDDKRVRISTCTSNTNYDSALYVEEGIDNIACPDIGGFFREDFMSVEDLDCDATGNAATVEFVTRRGTNYRIAVAGRNEEDKGSFGLSLFFYAMVENDECINAISLNPLEDDDTAIVIGSTASAVWANRDTFNGSPVVYYLFVGDDKRVRISTCTANTNYDSALYVEEGIDNIACPDIGGFFREDFMSVEDLDCDATGNAATIEFVAQRGTNYRIAVAGRNEEDKGSFGLSLFFYAKVENDECINAISVAPVTDSSTVRVGSTTDAIPAGEGIFNDSPVVYYQFTGDNTNTRVSTCTPETDFDTAIYIQRGLDNIACPQTGGFFRVDFSTETADPSCASSNGATIEFLADSGVVYRIAVSGRVASDTGTFGLSIMEM